VVVVVVILHLPTTVVGVALEAIVLLLLNHLALELPIQLLLVRAEHLLLMGQILFLTP
jgi:hypothetical protein